MSYAQHFKNPMPQDQPLPGRQQIENAAGGYVFAIDDWQRLRRFLILGCSGGTYYEGERKLTLENAEVIKRCLALDGPRTIETIVDVSDRGLAPKNDAAVFALAAATVFGDDVTRDLAFKALPKVCRIGTHLFQFCEAREALGGGWGRGMRKAVSRWYVERPVESLVMQSLKYQQRGGWSHRDLLRLAHPRIRAIGEADGKMRRVFDAVVAPQGGDRYGPSQPAGKGLYNRTARDPGTGWTGVADFNRLAEGYLRVQRAENASQAAALITEYGLPREFVPTQFLAEPSVWWALLPHMPMTALVRNLGNLGKAGVLVPMSEAMRVVAAKLADGEAIRKSRLHPFQILLAARTYGTGHGVKGSGTWVIVPQVIDALDSAFNLAFHNVEPTGKRFVLGVDVSGSMSFPTQNAMTCAEAAAAMALVTARTEPNYFIGGFSTQFVDLGITARDTLPSVLEKTRNRNFGGTDTAVAIHHALANKIETDAFVVYTDSETWAGNQHTCQALKGYRRKTGIPARLAVVAFTGTQRSVADTADAGSMDFVGMDASLPQALAAFVAE